MASALMSAIAAVERIVHFEDSSLQIVV